MAALIAVADHRRPRVADLHQPVLRRSDQRLPDVGVRRHRRRRRGRIGPRRGVHLPAARCRRRLCRDRRRGHRDRGGDRVGAHRGRGLWRRDRVGHRPHRPRPPSRRGRRLQRLAGPGPLQRSDRQDHHVTSWCSSCWPACPRASWPGSRSETGSLHRASDGRPEPTAAVPPELQPSTAAPTATQPAFVPDFVDRPAEGRYRRLLPTTKLGDRVRRGADRHRRPGLDRSTRRRGHRSRAPCTRVSLARTLVIVAITAPLVISIVLVNTFGFPNAPDAIGRVGPLTATWTGLTAAGQAILRVAAFALSVALFSLTTSVDALLADLERRGLGRRGSFIIGAALGMIPRIGERAAEVTDAQRARGLDTEGSWRKRLGGLVPLIGPVIIGSLTEVEERTMALEARGFSAPSSGRPCARSRIGPSSGASAGASRSARSCSSACPSRAAWRRSREPRPRCGHLSLRGSARPALDGIDLSIGPARSSASSARTRPASPRYASWPRGWHRRRSAAGSRAGSRSTTL